MEADYFFKSMESIGVNQTLLWNFAFESGLITRRRLITPSDILYAICFGSLNGTVSNNDIAAKINSDCNVSVSKQAIWKKINDSSVRFFKMILEYIITHKVSKQTDCNYGDLNSFKRVLVQDSTIIKLPKSLFSIFSGVSNGHSVVCNARIQGIYDLISEEFISFSVDAYSTTDLTVAGSMELKKGDLSLRDRGYYTVAEIRRHQTPGTDCIYRFKNSHKVYCSHSGKEIDLLKTLKKNQCMDRIVYLGSNKKTRIRIVAAPVSEAIANERRISSIKHSSSNPGEKTLKLLSWTIYITTLKFEEFSHKAIYKLYSLRWRIEIIFKCWKSNMSFSNIHNVSHNQLVILIYARFIMIVIIFQFIYKPCRIIIHQKYNKVLSLFKLTKYISRNVHLISQIIIKIKSESKQDFCRALARYCSYDKRKRPSYQEEFDSIFA